MKPVLLIDSLPENAPRSLQGLIEQSGTFSCVRTELKDLFTNGLAIQRPYSAAVLDCDYLDGAELACVMKLSTITHEMPIVVAARQIALESYRKIDQLKNTIAIQKGFQPEVFRSLLTRVCAGGSEFKPSICPRFVTDEAVRVILLESGLIINSRMRNYSSGGLFLEYRGISLKIGDAVQVSVPCPAVSSTKKHLHLKARVVWERSFGNPRSPARGVGLQIQPGL